MPTLKKTNSKIIAAKPYKDVQSSNTNYMHKLGDKTVVNFIYNFFFIGYFCLVSFIVKFTFFTLESSGKLATMCSFIILIAFSGSRAKLIFKLLILGAFLSPCHRHLLSLSNESLTSLAYPKSYEFKIILCVTHSINRENNGYNLNFHLLNTLFCSTHSVFNSYIFVTGRNDSDQNASDGINNFAVHYPHISRQKSENPAYFFLNISVAILFALKQHQKSNTRMFSLF